jgi:hypothetical protein
MLAVKRVGTHRKPSPAQGCPAYRSSTGRNSFHSLCVPPPPSPHTYGHRSNGGQLNGEQLLCCDTLDGLICLLQLTHAANFPSRRTYEFESAELVAVSGLSLLSEPAQLQFLGACGGWEQWWPSSMGNVVYDSARLRSAGRFDDPKGVLEGGRRGGGGLSCHFFSANTMR